MLYLFLKQRYSYWEHNGFKTLAGTSLIFGHFKGPLSQKEFAGDFIKRLYESTNEPFVGIYAILRPILLLRDPELIRSVLIKDSAYFPERNVHCNEKYDPLSGNLFSLRAEKSKNLRSKLTPAFSTGKLKAMFPTLINCASTLQTHLEKYADQDKLLDIRELASRYTINCITGIGFGIEADAIADPNSEFRECGREIFKPSFLNGIRWFLFLFAPKLMSLLRIKIVNSSVERFLTSVVKQNLEFREKNNVIRKYFFQMLIQLRNTGAVQSDDQWEAAVKENDDNSNKLTFNEICAQTFVFFGAGFETSALTLSFCLYELAKNPEIQDRVYDEINKVLAEHNGELTYDSLSLMKSLENCFDGEICFCLVFCTCSYFQCTFLYSI